MYKLAITFWTIIVILQLSSVGLGLKELPPYFPRCRRYDPNMEKCLIEATEQLKPFIAEGIKGLIPATKRIVIPFVTFEQSGNRAFNFKVKVTNLTVHGMNNYKFKRYMFDPKELTSYVVVDWQHIYLEAEFDLVGNLFFANIKGAGNLYVNITDTQISTNITMRIVKRKGIEYLENTKVAAKVQVGTIASYSFDGVFKENKDKGSLTTTVLKNNLRALINETAPVVEPALATYLEKAMSKPMETIPYNNIFPI
ncbi:uncharacterized protein LOC114341819 [Diabrotica virgifera virgifera]|uniref:Uncharacterized protein LOC114341819 n=1 Tax=Diabrotica virgifera virgifera TaxID=50390 RepID=A0A6P7GFK0_DIAVI|nr:uncharacterized protein LOC114341819 [Diabrotica virgifera virgifera]